MLVLLSTLAIKLQVFRLKRCLKFLDKGSIGYTFMVCIHADYHNQGNIYLFILLEISVLDEFPFGHQSLPQLSSTNQHETKEIEQEKKIQKSTEKKSPSHRLLLI
ncbi:hypothetical protein K457DRAFT_76184 [Linnemannia elongata AG-77]|uniref:Uncharacterized protein n=1 Tax=Linnemannia elongata AG-77 TaxID=1314771 RepID=A0A197JTT1_9FUNG|nr:hypothetical protein K457DRAFT_76184 [Linnemannia elongata AG-77]